MSYRVTKAEFAALQARLAKGRAAVPPAAKKVPRTPALPGPPAVPEPPDLSAQVAALPGAARSWALLMPYGDLRTSNQRLHHMAAHRLTSRMRKEAAQMARVRRLPRLERAAVFYVLHPRALKRQRDPGNWALSAKAYVDGLVDAGVLPDDNSAHLAGPFPEMGPPVPTGGARMTLVIVELTLWQDEAA